LGGPTGAAREEERGWSTFAITKGRRPQRNRRRPPAEKKNASPNDVIDLKERIAAASIRKGVAEESKREKSMPLPEKKKKKTSANTRSRG